MRCLVFDQPRGNQVLAGYIDAIGVHVISQMANDVGVPLRIVIALCI